MGFYKNEIDKGIKLSNLLRNIKKETDKETLSGKILNFIFTKCINNNNLICQRLLYMDSRTGQII